MRCTNKKQTVFRRRKKRKIAQLLFRLCLGIMLIAAVAGVSVFFLSNRAFVTDYEFEQYGGQIYQEAFVVDELCVASEDVANDAFQTDDELHAAGLFNLDEYEVEYARDVHERLYPASTTKILTAYLAIKYGNLEDIVTVSENAVGVPLDSSRAGLRTGDQLTLEALLYGLMLPSGNDSAVAIAEHISGSEAKFTALMNEEARKLGATNSNFVNAHGYHDENHYTTAYDLYLILKECVQYDKFLEIISSTSYRVNITQKNGTYRDVTWNQTNLYVNGNREMPAGLSVIGGKTGTTDEAGACLVLYAKDKDAHSYISIVMGADTKLKLYDNMTELISVITSN